MSDIPSGFFVEMGRYEIEIDLDGASLPDDAAVIVNSVPIDRVSTRGRAFYPFESGFHAGRLEINVLGAGQELATALVVINPDDAKLTREDYAELLADLAKSTVALYRLGGLSMPSPTSATGTRNLLVLFETLRACFDDFENAVRKVAEHPNRRLSNSYRHADVMRARRPDDRAFTRALAGRGVRVATPLEAQAAPRLVQALKGQWVPTIRERFTVDEFNVYENRAILGFLVWLEGQLAVAHQKLQRGSVEFPQSLLAVWTGRIRDWSRRVAHIRRAPSFQNLIPEPILKSTSVFRIQPEYARLFTLMARLRGGLGIGANILPALPLERTFALYEMWVYVRLLLAAAEQFPLCRTGVATLLAGLDAPHRLGTSLRTGAASELQLTDTIFLTYQRRFSPSPDKNGCRTRLIEAVPDITISRVDSAACCTGLVVFDPKYRGGSSLLDGVRDLHVYRDAIRNGADMPLTVAAVALAPRSFDKDDEAIWSGTSSPGIVGAKPGISGDVFGGLLQRAVLALERS